MKTYTEAELRVWLAVQNLLWWTIYGKDALPEKHEDSKKACKH